MSNILNCGQHLQASADVRAICRQHWFSSEGQCDGCPLHDPCVTEVPKGRLTVAKIDEWTAKRNAKAETLNEHNC